MIRVPMQKAAAELGIHASEVGRKAKRDGVRKEEMLETDRGLRRIVTVPRSWLNEQIKRRAKARSLAAASKS